MEQIVPDSHRPLYDNWHFAPAVVHDGIAFLSGVIGTRPDGSCAEDAEEQFTDLFEGLAAVLAAAGIGFEDVIEMTSYHTDMSELRMFGKVRDRYMGEPWCAWTAIGCTALALPGARCEVRVTARRP